MNANNEFDKLVKDKLAQGQPSVPKDTKEDIERMLVKHGLIKKDDQGRKYFYVAFSVIAFFAILTATVFNFEGSKKNAKDVNVTKVKTNENVVVFIEESIAASKSKKEKTESMEVNKAEQNSKTNSRISSKTKEVLVSKNNPKEDSKLTIPSGVTLNKNQMAGPVAANEAVTGVTIANAQSTENVENVENVSVADNSSDALNRSRDNNLSGSESAALGKEGQPQSNTISEINNLETIETGQAILVSDSATKQINVVNSDSVPKVVAVDSAKKDTSSFFNYSLEAFGGIQQSYMQNTGGTGGSQSSTQSVSNSEWIAGLKFTLFYKKNFTLGTGVNYSMHQSEISHDFNSFMYDSNGVIPISFPAHVKTDFNVTEIPILIGYYFEMKKFAMHLESGVSISFISNANSVLKLDDSPQSIDNFSGVNPVKSYSGFVGQFSLLYSISQRFQVFLQPSINVGLSEIFEGMPDRKINVVSGRTGLRINF